MKNMRNRKKLPIGIDSFEKIIRHNFYYVDKTEMITELLHNWGEVNLFTRPRRFGKSLNMNMLQSFLEIGCDKSLFNGLKVSREKELCEEYMGKFPVISLTLKNVEGLNFESARKSLKNTLGMEAWRLSALAESSRLTEEEKNSYKALTVVDDHGDFKMSDATMEKALLILTVLLEKHYGKKAVLLIDEYDVPLDKAFQYGYYDEMVSLIRNMFGNVLKTNSSLFFAVLTGCLRIAKESIFTGLNNFNVFSITSVQFDEFFGFTDDGFRMLAEDEINMSILAKIGSAIAWIFHPLGWGNWQAAVASITGLVAKENIVGTMGILYGGGELPVYGELALQFTKLAGFSFLTFNLLCAPCFAAIGAIKREMNSPKWTWAAIGYQCGFAYVVSLCIYNIGNLIAHGTVNFWTIVAFALVIGFLYLLFRPYEESNTLKVNVKKSAKA